MKRVQSGSRLELIPSEIRQAILHHLIEPWSAVIQDIKMKYPFFQPGTELYLGKGSLQPLIDAANASPVLAADSIVLANQLYQIELRDYELEAVKFADKIGQVRYKEKDFAASLSDRSGLFAYQRVSYVISMNYCAARSTLERSRRETSAGLQYYAVDLRNEICHYLEETLKELERGLESDESLASEKLSIPLRAKS